MTIELKWWQTHENLVSLGEWLVENEGYDARNLLHFFEKPWHYDDEWANYQAEEAKANADQEA